MPSEPSPRAPRPEPQSHRARDIAESFGVDAARYDRARARYPHELVAALVPDAGVPTVLDVGCGTGILARQLQALGATVLGVDPDPRMAAFARGSGVPVEEGTFESWDPRGRTFDLVVAGQSWHWVDPDAGAEKAARILRPGGTLALLGHVFDSPPALASALTAAYRRVAPDSPFAAQPPGSALATYERMVASMVDGIVRTRAFTAAVHRRVETTRHYTREAWLDHLASTGALTPLAADQVADVLGCVGEAIDGLGGRFSWTFTTVAVTVSRAS